MVYGAIGAKYINSGGPASLGMPLDDEFSITGGREQEFEYVNAFWTPAGGVTGLG